MKERIQILDNTLREGEQAPGLWFTFDEKLALFEALQDAGVDMIDVGIPATSQEDARFCEECAKRAGASVVGVSIRALREEVDLAKGLGVAEVFLMFPFSEIHIMHKFSTTVDEIKGRCRDLVEYAHKQKLRVNLVAEDASRGSAELVCDLAGFSAKLGIERLFLCDTVGAARPSQFARFVEDVSLAVSGLCQLGVHCHNDLGLATANTLAAVEAGADVVSGTVNGLGERAGNAPLHEIALALSLLLKVEHGLDVHKLPGLSDMMERFSGVFLSPLAPIVGRNAFRHESGIHVDGILKASRVYEELKPETVGRRREFVLGKSTGINHLRALLSEKGIEADDAALRRLQERVRQEIMSRDKTASQQMRQALDDYYRDSFGFPMARFWELVDEVIG